MTFAVNVLIIIATLYVSAKGLRCFKCTDINEGPCFDSIGMNASSATCPGTHTNQSITEHLCFYLNATNLSTGLIIILRDCGAANYTCGDVSVDGISVNSCRTCSKDLCNAGRKPELDSWLFILMMYLFIGRKIKT